MKSWAKPTPDLVARAIAGMRHLEQQRYFFDRLENPEWIEPLHKAQFFKEPPTPEQNDEWVRYRLWPASRYLSRMAALKPDLVADIMSHFPVSDSPYVVQDILTAAAAMPAASAVKLTDVVAAAAQSGGFVVVERAGEIATNLAAAGFAKPSIKILKSVFDVVPDPRPIMTMPSGHQHRHAARTRIRSFDYGNILRIYGPDLTHVLGVRYLELLSKKLSFALKQEYPFDNQSHRTVADYSYIWRPHLEFATMHEEASHLLITGVLQSAELMVTSGMWTRVLTTLQSQPHTVFERIQLFLLAKNPQLDIPLAAKKLADTELFHDLGVRQEFDALARAVFPLLSQEQQLPLLKLISDEMDTTHLVKRGLSPEQIEHLVRQWKFERYEPIKDYLTNSHRTAFDALTMEFGNSHEYTNPVVRGFAQRQNSDSPISEEKLRSMAIGEVIDFLNSWSPNKQNPFGPSYGGLATEFAKVVASRPEFYIERMEELKALKPTYLRAVLQGLRDAAKNGYLAGWPHLLSLAEWICDQPISEVIDKDENSWDGPDTNWLPSRFAIVGMLEDALQNDLLPTSEYTVAWSLLSVLATGTEHELDYRDPASLEKDVWSYSLNTLRPRAIRGILNYIEWWQRHLKTEDLTADSVTEIAELLDKHLDVDVERSLDVRLIYGEKLPFLCAVMPQWAGRAIDRIFPDADELKPLRDVAWGAYLAANQAYVDVFHLAERQYREAIHIADNDRRMGKSHLLEQPSSMLGHHLVQLYWWGKLDLSEDSILVDFLAAASESDLRSMLIYVGRSLSEAPEEVGNEIVTRLQQLWDYIATSDIAVRFPKLFANFGWWFNTKYFEDLWAIERLHASLILSDGGFEPMLEALSRLSRMVELYPQLTLESTKRIVLTQDDYIGLWTEHLSQILTTILAIKDVDLSTSVTALVNELGRRGHLEYRGLLNES